MIKKRRLMSNIMVSEIMLTVMGIINMVDYKIYSYIEQVLFVSLHKLYTIYTSFK